MRVIADAGQRPDQHVKRPGRQALPLAQGAIFQPRPPAHRAGRYTRTRPPAACRRRPGREQHPAPPGSRGPRRRRHEISAAAGRAAVASSRPGHGISHRLPVLVQEEPALAGRQPFHDLLRVKRVLTPGRLAAHDVIVTRRRWHGPRHPRRASRSRGRPLTARATPFGWAVIASHQTRLDAPNRGSGASCSPSGNRPGPAGIRRKAAMRSAGAVPS